MCLVLCVTFSACRHDDAIILSDNGNTMEPTAKKDDNSFSEEWTNGACNDREDETSIDVPDTPTIITFSSTAEIIEFISAANGTQEQFTNFNNKQSINNIVTQSTAKAMAINLAHNILPATSSKIIVEEFVATYYVERDELDLHYLINGLHYRFTYRYNYTKEFTYDTAPILTNVKLGSFSFDMYQGDKWIYGSFRDGTTSIAVSVYTQQPEDISFNSFTFTKHDNDAVIE